MPHLDGFSHGMTGNLRALRYATAHHENMELKLYEPLDLIRPWTWNNRLHDKYIIADNKLAIIGGRNIGLRYFDPNNKQPVNDRQVALLTRYKITLTRNGNTALLNNLGCPCTARPKD